MLDPRILASRRDEIVESCRRRRVTADVDGAIRAQERLAAAQTELGEANRRRNEHQASGKRKLEGAEREAHVAQGRRLKDEVAELEAAVTQAQRALETAMAPIPNLVHPQTPEGDEANFRELRRVGTPRTFSFEPLDHVTLGEKLALVDFEAGAKVTGQKFYFLKNEAVLLELALQRLALDIVMRARLHALHDARSGASERGRCASPSRRAAPRRRSTRSRAAISI